PDPCQPRKQREDRRSLWREQFPGLAHPQWETPGEAGWRWWPGPDGFSTHQDRSRDMQITLTTATMSSREIAELTDKRHDNVKRTSSELHAAGLISNPQIEEIRTATTPVQVFLLGKRDTLVVVARLSPEFTARVVDRWQELEEQAAPALPRTM